MIFLQVQFCSPSQFVLFGRRDTLQATAEVVVLAVSHFDKDQHLAVQHDEIDLTVTAAEILLHSFQAL